MFIAGDWGTSNLRLYLCRSQSPGQAEIVARVNGPGVSNLQGAFEHTFFELTQDWFTSHGNLPVILAGMVGSTIGWQEAPYQSCPIPVSQVITERQLLQVRNCEITIVAGLQTSNPLGVADVMRGEEMQLLGWSLQPAANGESRQLVAMPGTHNKWATVHGGVIDNFLSSLAGELYALLQGHSVLLAGVSESEFSREEFLAGVRAIRGLGRAHLVHALFTTRARQVTGDLATNAAASYLSGLIVGSDVTGAVGLFSELDWPGQTVHVIGEDALSDLYALAMSEIGVGAERYQPEALALAAFSAIYHHYYVGGNT